MLPEGMAKLIKAGSDLVFEIHYTPNGKPAPDQTQVALVFAKSPPQKRVLTLQMDIPTFQIPPGDPNHRVTVSGTLPNDALILGFFPHMHLRGKPSNLPDDRLMTGSPETLLQSSAVSISIGSFPTSWPKPLPLKKGTRLDWVAWFDNSANNPRNPDPDRRRSATGFRAGRR